MSSEVGQQQPHTTSSPATLATHSSDSGAVKPARNPLAGYNPVADSDAVVIAPNGAARFTVLTSQLIRMEYKLGSPADHRAVCPRVLV